MDDRFKNALDDLISLKNARHRYFEHPLSSSEAERYKYALSDVAKHIEAIESALTLATEPEQLRKERDELQAKLDKAIKSLQVLDRNGISDDLARTTLEEI